MSTPDAAGRARRALIAIARAVDATVVVDVVRSTSWASALFVGERVEFVISAGDESWITDWLEALPEAEIMIPGYFVGDVVVGQSRSIDGKRCCDILMLLIQD